MKKPFFLLTILIILISCEETNKSSINFNEQIVDGYFVKSIAFDKQGNAWIGTFKQGLIKYRADETIVYNSENSIISDASVIYDIAVDSKNNVWIACDGLIKYDGTEFTYFKSTNSPIPEDFIRSIAIDSKDNIWFSSSRFRQGGVVKYDGVEWNVYTPENSELPVNSVQSVTIDKDDNVWLALGEIVNNSYLVKISGDKWTTYTSDDLGFIPYHLGNIQIDSKKRVYGAIDYSLSSVISGDRPHIFMFDGNETEQIKNDSILNVNFITIDNQDNIWCATTFNGYAIYNEQKWTIDNLTFKDAGIFAIEQAPDNRIWIGTNNGIRIGNKK